MVSMLHEATLLSIVIRSVVSHVLIYHTDRVEAPLARSLCLTDPINWGIVLRWFLH